MKKHKKASRKFKKQLASIVNLSSVVGLIGATSIITGCINELYNFDIIKRFKLWSGYQILLVRRRK